MASSTPRPWSAHEDALLRHAVAVHGDEPGVWKTVADAVPGRSNKACRKRWLHSLSPTIRKTPWTPAEDQLLLSLYATHKPPRWSLIARHIPGRTDDACAKRYREALDPLLKRDSWSPEEDAKLLDLTARLGTKWSQVGHAMGRSGLGCRNRWRLLERKQHPRNSSRPSPAILPPFLSTSHHYAPQPTYSPPPAPLAIPFQTHQAHQHPDPSFSQIVPIHAPPPCTISTVSSLSGALASSSIDPDPSPLDNHPPHNFAHSPHPSPPSTPGPTQVVIVSSPTPAPPPHPAADPATGTPPPALPRKRPRLRGPPDAEQVHRLSSHLPADLDRTVLPYACGHPLCWPGSAESGSSCFPTASELAEHRRLAHPIPESAGEGAKLYRCALQGCGKAWKNINGIQYHLQISKAHFLTALNQSRAPSDDAPPSSLHPPSDVIRPESIIPVASRIRKKRKVHPCPHHGCTNTYKQRTGLQYHLAHGHPANIAQLEVIPPALMRKINAGAQPPMSGQAAQTTP